MDRQATVLNCLTALDVDGAKIPVDFATDREALGQALTMQGLKPPSEARVVWIRNTGQVGELVCSAAFREEVSSMPHLDAVSDLHELPISAAGLLDDNYF